MPDEQVTPPAPITTEQPIPGNDPAARTETGELRDNLSAKTPEQAPSTEAKVEPEVKVEPPKAGEVPEKYDFKAPVGATLDPKLIEEASPIFKELGLDNAAAQKLVDFYAKTQAAAGDVMTEMRTGWRNEVVGDKDIGDGKDNLRPEVRANISKAFDAIGDAKVTSAFKEALDLTGAGDHPAVIRALNTLGKLLGEGTLVSGGKPSPAGQTNPAAKQGLTPAQRMFPNLPSSAQR